MQDRLGLVRRGAGVVGVPVGLRVRLDVGQEEEERLGRVSPLEVLEREVRVRVDPEGPLERGGAAVPVEQLARVAVRGEFRQFSR